VILHILKKDIRLLWPYAAVVVLTGYLGTLFADREPLSQIWSLAEIAKILGAGLLIAAAVHQDVAPGVRQDWIVRPIARRDLIAAKLLFVITMLLLPVMAGDILQLTTGGFSLGQSVKAALIRGTLLLCVIYLPVLGIASITRNFKETVVAAVVGALGFVLLAQLWHSGGASHWRRVTHMPTGVDWIVETAIFALAAVSGAAILILQYTTRRTLRARCLAVAAGLACFSLNFVPWQPVFAIQRSLSPQPGGASAIQLVFQPQRGPFRRNDSIYPAEVRLPMTVTGLPADDVLRTDLVQARLITPEGKVETFGYGAIPLNYTTIALRDNLYSKLKDRTVRLELDYSLTLLRLTATRTMPLNSEQRIPEFGRCKTTSAMIQCEQAAMTPPCAIINGNVLCSGSYSPFSLQAEPDPLRRLRVGIEANQTQVVSRWYDVVEHFTRHVVIPEIRLSDWRTP
jgi:hypothetical protein